MPTPATNGPPLRSSDTDSQRVTTIETAILLMAVRQAWVNCAWVATWFGPDEDAVRALLITIMLGSLIVAATIPEAFEAVGWRSRWSTRCSRCSATCS